MSLLKLGNLMDFFNFYMKIYKHFNSIYYIYTFKHKLI